MLGTDICNYSDDTILYVRHTDTTNILNKSESPISIVTGWFNDNCMRLHEDKCHFRVFGDQSNDLTIQIDTIPIAEGREQTSLEITLDKNWHLRRTLNHYVQRKIKTPCSFPHIVHRTA